MEFIIILTWGLTFNRRRSLRISPSFYRLLDQIITLQSSKCMELIKRIQVICQCHLFGKLFLAEIMRGLKTFLALSHFQKLPFHQCALYCDCRICRSKTEQTRFISHNSAGIWNYADDFSFKINTTLSTSQIRDAQDFHGWHFSEWIHKQNRYNFLGDHQPFNTSIGSGCSSSQGSHKI